MTASPTTAREEILTRIRRALADAPTEEASEPPRDYLREHGPQNEPEATKPATPDAEAKTSRDHLPEHGPRSEPATPDLEAEISRDYLSQHGALSESEMIELLAENLADYRAQVHRSSAADLAGTVARLLAEQGSGSVVVPEGLPAEWLAEIPSTVAAIPDSADLTARRLDEVHAVVSGCALAIAETGTIVLDGGPGQGRRLLTLVPDHHICVVRVPDQVVASVPQAFARGGLAPDRPQTWIAGPSATSDIELDRVEGVHGPRKLDVVLVAL